MSIRICCTASLASFNLWKQSITRFALGKLCFTILRMLFNRSKVPPFTSSRYSSSIWFRILQTSSAFVPATIASYHVYPYRLRWCKVLHWTNRFHLWRYAVLYFLQTKANAVCGIADSRNGNFLMFPCVIFQSCDHWCDSIAQAYGKSQGLYPYVFLKKASNYLKYTHPSFIPMYNAWCTKPVLVWKRHCSNIRAGTQEPPLRFHLGGLCMDATATCSA